MFQSFLEYTKNTAINKKLIDQYGKIKVYVVDGKAVRDSSKESQEFGEDAIHVDFPKLISKNEIWIEQDIVKQERYILIASSLYRIKLLSNGESQQQVYDKAIKKEKKYRESVLLLS